MIAITPGEPAGIGPDLVIQAAQQDRSQGWIVVADVQMLQERAQLLQLPISINEHLESPSAQAGELTVLNTPLAEPVRPGELSVSNAKGTLHALDRAIAGCLEGRFTALVTGPMQKSVMMDAGFAFSGHTEHLAQRSGVDDVVMMLSGKGLNVCLLTTHVPLKSVVEHINQTTIQSKIRIICSHYNSYYPDRIPKIALLGINPHAGDGGVLGTEEQEIMAPVLRFFQNDPTVKLTGPFPADAFFGRKQFLEVDVVLAAHHDQGLAPFKLWSMGKGVNCTLGLPFIRTSPDHGTAFDIAGKWIAEHDSMLEAYNVALAYLTRATKPSQA